MKTRALTVAVGLAVGLAPCIPTAAYAAAHTDDPVANAESMPGLIDLAIPNTGDRRPPIDPDQAPRSAVPSAEPSRVAVTLGLDIPSAYYSRGTLVENNGFIAQPYALIAVTAYRTDDLTITPFVGIWNSFHEERTDAPRRDRFKDTWNEATPHLGLVLERGPWSLEAAYLFVTSPADAFTAGQELWFTLAYADEPRAEGPFAQWSLNPSTTLIIETGEASQHGSDNGVYLQFDLEPSRTFSETAVGDLTLSFPCQVGLGLWNFYEDENDDDEVFGFVAIGTKLAIPLAFLSGRGAGDWTFSLSGSALFLGDTNREANEGEAAALLGMASLTCEF